jgi:hypothetical protein
MSTASKVSFIGITLLALGACEKPYGNLGDYSTSDTDSAGTSGTGDTGDTDGASSTAASATEASGSTGEPECMPGQTKDELCGNHCDCSENGTWACTDKGCVSIVEGFEADLVNFGGCSDMVMTAGDAFGTVVLHIEGPGMVKFAKNAGKVTEQIIPITDPSLKAEILTGSALDMMFCNDVVPNASIDLRYVPVAGEVTFKVTPVDGPDPNAATASATFKNVTWKLETIPDSEDVPMADFTIPEVPVGWLPG